MSIVRKQGYIKIPLSKIKNRLPIITQKYSYIQQRTEEIITTFNVDKKFVYLPRNLSKLKQLFGNSLEVEDNTLDIPLDKDIEFTQFILRDYQQKLLNNILEKVKQGNTDFLINAATGFGKTYVLPSIISNLNQKTLIIVDRELLVDQMIKEIETNTKHKVNKVNRDTTTVEDINLVTNQMLVKNPHLTELFKNSVGLVVLDEAHIAGAKTFKDNIQAINSKYRIGLSATPTRSDGLQEVLTDIFSCPLKVNYKADVKIQALLVQSQMYVDGENYRDLISKLMKENDFVLDLLIHYSMRKDHQMLIAVNDKIEQQRLAKKYSQYGTAIINSSTKKADRERILDLYDKGEIRLLFGYGVLEKGISIPEMTILVNWFAATTKEKIEQLLGRLNRESRRKDVEKIYIDFVFPSIMHRQFETKLNTLTKMKKKLNLKIKRMDISKFIRQII